jgi:hypothetical protein
VLGGAARDTPPSGHLATIDNPGVSNAARFAIAGATTVAGMGVGALIGARRGGQLRAGAAYGAGFGALLSASVLAGSWQAGRLEIGNAKGSFSQQVKVGETSRLGLCNHPGSTDSNDKYLCRIDEPVYQQRSFASSSRVSLMARVDGQPTLDGLIDAIDGSRGFTAIVRSADGYAAHSLSYGHLTSIRSQTATHPGVIAIMHDGGVEAIGPQLTAQERAALQRR